MEGAQLPVGEVRLSLGDEVAQRLAPVGQVPEPFAASSAKVQATPFSRIHTARPYHPEASGSVTTPRATRHTDTS